MIIIIVLSTGMLKRREINVVLKKRRDGRR